MDSKINDMNLVVDLNQRSTNQDVPLIVTTIIILPKKSISKMGEKKKMKAKANKLVYMFGIQFILCILAGL